jgi:dipeptide/tripeptide permease
MGQEPALVCSAALMAIGSLLLLVSANSSALLMGAVIGGVGYTGAFAGGCFRSSFNPVLASLVTVTPRTSAMVHAELATGV